MGLGGAWYLFILANVGEAHAVVFGTPRIPILSSKTYFAEAHITLLLYALSRGVKGLLFA